MGIVGGIFRLTEDWYGAADSLGQFAIVPNYGEFG
jgi:hypothetical protein